MQKRRNKYLVTQRIFKPSCWSPSAVPEDEVCTFCTFYNFVTFSSPKKIWASYPLLLSTPNCFLVLMNLFLFQERCCKSAFSAVSHNFEGFYDSVSGMVIIFYFANLARLYPPDGMCCYRRDSLWPHEDFCYRILPVKLHKTR